MAAEPVPGVLGPVPAAWRASAQVTSHAPGVTGAESTQGHQSAALGGLIAAAAGPVGALVAEATRLARSGEPVPGALDALQRVDALVAALALAQAGLTAVAKAQATRRELGGERSFGDWRSRTTRLGRGAVLTQERTAETLTTLPAVHDAVADGGLTFAHAQVLAQALAEAGEKARKHLGDHVEEIVAIGRSLTVVQLRQHLSARVDALEADAADDAFHAARARRFLTLTTRGGGVAVEGFLDPVAGATVRTALEALTRCRAPTTPAPARSARPTPWCCSLIAPCPSAMTASGRSSGRT